MIGPIDDVLRTWAGDQPTLQAAVELLVRAFDGALVQADRPWVERDHHGPWINFTKTTPAPANLTSPQRNVLLLAASLAAGVPIDLGSTLPGLDRDTLALVLAAVAHAGRKTRDVRLDRRQHLPGTARPTAVVHHLTRFPVEPSLFPWPVTPPPPRAE